MKLETFFSISEQTMQFLMSAIMGTLLGVLYDCFRVTRIILPALKKKGAVFVSDVLFMLCCGAAYFLFSYVFCRGYMRFYCIAGAALGFTLYILTIGNFITGLIRKLFTAVYGFLQKVYSIVFNPIVNILKRFYKKILHIFVHSYENTPKIQ